MLVSTACANAISIRRGLPVRPGRERRAPAAHSRVAAEAVQRCAHGGIAERFGLRADEQERVAFLAVEILQQRERRCTSGTRCSRRDFMRAAGTVHTALPKSISSHVASRALKTP